MSKEYRFHEDNQMGIADLAKKQSGLNEKQMKIMFNIIKNGEIIFHHRRVINRKQMLNLKPG